MYYLNILAQTTQTPQPAGAAETTEIVPIDWIYEQITTLTWFQAVIAVAFGVVYLLYGWRIFKVLAVVSFGLLGMWGGMWVGRQVGGHELGGGLIGTGVLAVLSVPLIRYAVSILGAVAGAVITGGLWYAVELPETYIWAGGLVGAVAGGMISFIVFKAAVMLFTSMGGSVIMMSGLLALFYHYEENVNGGAVHVHELVYEHNWFLPVVVIVPTIIGLFVQHKLVKGAQNWQI